MLKQLLQAFTRKPQNARKRVIETTLAQLYASIEAGILPQGDNVVVETRLGKLAWVEPTGKGGFNVLVWGEELVNSLAPYEAVEVIYGS